MKLFLPLLLLLLDLNLDATNQCFSSDNSELTAAVFRYTLEDCTNTPDCEVGQIYGYLISSWCTSNITDMAFLFRDKDTFNEDLSGWDTSNVVNMYKMFEGAKLFDGDISKWQVGRVTNMRSMVSCCGDATLRVLKWLIL